MVINIMVNKALEAIVITNYGESKGFLKINSLGTMLHSPVLYTGTQVKDIVP